MKKNVYFKLFEKVRLIFLFAYQIYFIENFRKLYTEF